MKMCLIAGMMLAVLMMAVAHAAPPGLHSPQPELTSAPPPPPPPPPPGSTGPRAPPQYPGMSIYAAEEGTVTMLVLVQPDGRPASVHFESSSGYRQLDHAARTAVLGWTFPANGGAKPGQPWYARLPVTFHMDPKLADKPGYWGAAYRNPHYVRASAPFPFPSVAAAWEAMLARYGSKSQSNLVSYPVPDADGIPVELWVFLDQGSAHAIALHFTRGGTLPAPSVAMSALCADGADNCEQRMKTLLVGPPFAREHPDPF